MEEIRRVAERGVGGVAGFGNVVVDHLPQRFGGQQVLFRHRKGRVHVQEVQHPVWQPDGGAGPVGMDSELENPGHDARQSKLGDSQVARAQ